MARLEHSNGATVPSDFYRIASAWADAGFGVFPLVPGTKKPRPGSHGVDDATTDLAQIADWSAENPQYEVGVAPDTGGCYVVDVDVKNGKQGDASLLQLEIEHRLPTTATTGTPSGGRHLWFKGRVRSTVETLAPGIDTRGAGGYVRVLEPPVAGFSPSDGPEWIQRALVPKERKLATHTDVELDLPVNVRRFEDYLTREDAPVEGQGSDAQCLRVACAAKDYGLSPSTCLDMMAAWAPDFDTSWLERKIENAWEFGQNEPGAKAMEDPAKVWDIAALIAWQPPVSTQTTQNILTSGNVSRYKLLSEAEQDALQPPAWCVEGWFPKIGTALLYGAPGSYKTFVATELAMSRASGQPFYGIASAGSVPVIYAAGEGAIGLGKTRRPAWRWAHGLMEPVPMYLTRNVPPATDAEISAFVAEIEAAGVKPGLIILDTAARVMAPAGLDENAAKDVGQFIKAVEALRDHFGCLIVVIHHAGKDAGRGARGSSNLPAGFDVVMSVEADKTTLTAKLTVEKQKDAEEPRALSLKGEKILGSLVFSAMTEAEASALEASTDTRLTRNDLGAALKVLNAHGPDRGQATRVVATQLVDAKELDLAPDAQERAIKAMMKELDRTKLKRDYTFADGSWGLAVTERDL